MSERYKNFLRRVGRDCQFKPLKNALYNYLKKDSENKRKNYPRLLEMMKGYWPQYKSRSMISHLLKDHHEEIFKFYLTTIFPFRKRGLKFEDPEAPTPVDFKLVYIYHYNLKEIAAIKEIVSELNIQEELPGILKRILIFAVSSFGPMAEQIFGRPFAFQFANIEAKSFDNGEWEVIAVMSAREQ